MAQHTQGKKKATLIVIPSVRFTKLIIFHLQHKHKFHPRPESPLHFPTEEPIRGYLKFSAKGTKREVFGMPIPNELITDDIRGADYYDAYLEKVAKHQRYLAGEEVSDPDSPAPKPAKSTKPKVTKQAKPVAPKAATKKPQLAPTKPKEKKRKQAKETTEATPPAKRAKAGKVVKKRTLKRSQQLVDEFVDEGIPLTEPGFGDLEADTQRAIEESLKDAHGAPRGPLPPVVFRETDTGKFQPLPEVEGKGKEKVGAEQAAQVLLNLQTPKKKSPAEQYIFQRRTSAPTEPSGHDESSSLYAELGLSDSDTESDEEVPPVVKSGAQEEGQAGPNPGNDTVSQPQSTPAVHAEPNLEHTNVEATDASSQPQPEQMDEGFTATVYPNVLENLKLTVDEPVIPEEPASSTGTLSSLQHLAKDFSFGDQFFNDKPSEADNEKTTADTEAESMVSVIIHQDISTIPPMISPVIDLVSRPDSSNVHRPLPTTATATATTTTTITMLLLPPQPQQGSLDPTLLKYIGELEQHIADLVDANLALEERLDKHGSRLYRLENQDIPNQVSKAVDEIVMDAVDWAMQAPLRKRFRDMPETDMKEILHNRIWESKSYQTHKDHMMKKKKKRQGSPKTPLRSPPHPPHPPPPSVGPSGTLGASSASGSSQSPPPPPPPSNNQGEELHMGDDTTVDEHAYSSSGEDIGRDHISTVNLRHSPAYEIVKVFHLDVVNLQFQMEECHKLLTDQVDNAILRYNVSKQGHVTIQLDFFFNKDLEYLRYGRKIGRHALSILKMKAAYYPDVSLEQMVPDQMWTEEECKYDVTAMYGISHWCFQRQRFYINRHTSEGDHMAVRTHMRILSIVRIKVFPMYGYNYMKKIVLRRANLKEYVISERDFKYMYPCDFEDLYLLNLQGHLNHLSPEDKKILTTAVNLWTKNLVIRQHVEDFQLGIKSYQMDKYGVQMIMRFNEIHKFSDGTLQQINEALDYRVKEFRVNKMNPGLDTRF
ncbi:hypothetical protein Tco_0300316 [Tanacetum coccineum]